MTTARCSCGFTELAEEQLTDHFHQVFEPADRIGNDGQAHEERARLTCQCGLTAGTPGELDAHLLAVFIPAGRTGRDGKQHETVAADDGA